MSTSLLKSVVLRWKSVCVFFGGVSGVGPVAWVFALFGQVVGALEGRWRSRSRPVVEWILLGRLGLAFGRGCLVRSVGLLGRSSFGGRRWVFVGDPGRQWRRDRHHIRHSTFVL